jgi:O-antigen/teichoic acid export membrane protein
LLAVPLTPFRQLAEASQRGYLVGVLLTAQALVITICSLILARLGWGITGQFAALVVGNLVFFGALVWDARRRHPLAFARGPLAAPEPAAEDQPAIGARIRQLGRPIFILHVCATIGLLSDELIVARILGPAVVVPFFLTQRLVTIAMGQVKGISNATWAGLVELHHRGEHAWFADRVLEVTRVTAVVGAAALVPIVAFNRSFVSLWVGPQQYGGDLVTLLAAANGVLGAISAVWIWLFDGTGLAARLVPMALLAATLNIAVSILATKFFGLWGPLLGTTLALVLVQMLWLPGLVRESFGIAARRLYAAMGWPLALAVPVTIGCGWVGATYPPRGWPTLVICMAAASLVYAAAAWFIVFSAAERALLAERIRTVIGRRRNVVLTVAAASEEPTR